MSLEVKKLREILDYDKNTGVFIWKVKKSVNIKIGQKAGRPNKYSGYGVIVIDKIGYKAHRLAWMYQYGSFPKGHIDHINRLRNDNRIANLRECSMAENKQNISLTRTRNGATIDMGVYSVKRKTSKNKWTSGIRLNKKRVHLGTFDTKKEALYAYLKAKRTLHPFFIG